MLEPGRKYNPATDKVFLVSRGGSDFINSPILINGASDLPVSRLSAGVQYPSGSSTSVPRNFACPFRFALRADLCSGAIAKDGTDLPPQQAAVREANFNLGVGETYDFEFQPETQATLTLEAKGETQTRTATLEVH